MTTRELYVKGGRVWVPHPEKVWEGAVLLEDYSVGRKTLKVATEDTHETKVLEINSDSDLPPLRNPDILIGENNLTSLSFLHEPAVLYNLRVRFQRHCIYTYCGIVLVAFNPYNELPIYGNDTIWTYRGQAMGDLEPHVFAVAEEAYTKLEREAHDQSIIVSGESGAGKTVSAKYMMRYFATVGGSSQETQVEKKVLASLPIMEAIGNAKTTRNDNSSRFGKFIEIQFDNSYNITGASMRTYLLEKSRVVFQAENERNYHVFYQMCAAAARLPHLHLSHQMNFHYLNQGNDPSIDGVDDLASFDDTVSALTMLGFSSRQQDEMFRILAAILHLGNVNITTDGQGGDDDDDNDAAEASFISPSDRHLLTIAELLGTDVEAMRQWLCHRKFVSTREAFLKPMSVEQAIRARDALAKHIYAELFTWIVAGVNASLQAPGKAHRFIGVLDIYGFETFDTNSFEQFCINYANEKLQQQFNQHVFKLQQEEYLKEEIEWTFIDFYDNQPCIDLIETKLGILDLLDEECRMPKGSDSSWAEKLYSKCGKSKHFEKPRFGTSAFLVRHFADRVRYETPGFLEKNRDTVVEEQVNVLRASENKLLRKLFSDEDPKLAVPHARVKVSAQKMTPSLASTTNNVKQNKKTVGSQFRDSLNLLMSTLNATTPYYVRCIKPNDSKEVFEYDPVRAVQQLRACGVLETIRISAAGFPSQRTYAEFFQRYRCLCRFSEIQRDDVRETCKRILTRYINDEDKYKFGKTKVLFRAGQVAYLEKLRAERQRDACVTIQKTVRGLICRNVYRRVRRAILGLQRHGRGYLARQKAEAVRRERAAVKIQARVRGWLQRIRYLRTKRAALGLQAYGRGLLARRRYARMKDNAAATTIQRFARGYLVRMACKKKLQQIITVQCCVRKYQAKKLFRKLKAEARSVEHVKSLNKGLELKIISLQQKLNELAKENQSLKNTKNEVLDLKAKLEALKAVESESKRLHGAVLEKEKELEKMRETVKLERDEKMDLLQEKERETRRKEEENGKLLEENEKLRAELAIVNEKLRNSVHGAEESHRLALEKDLILRDQDQDRGAYQRLLKDYHDLEQYCEMLKQRQAAIQHVPGHSRSLSNASSSSGHNAPTAAELVQDDQNIDFGYGSVRSTVSSSTPYSRVETIDWNQQRSDTPPDSEIGSSKSPSEINGSQPHVPTHAPVDITLVLKLQQKLKDVERENCRLIRRVEDLERDFDNPEDSSRTEDGFRVQELEMENEQLKQDLDSLRKTVSEADSTSAQQNLMDQFYAQQRELERRREECIHLHSVLADNTRKMKNFSASYGRDVDIINEDGELVLAFEAQKKINRQLEDELQASKKTWQAQRDEWRAEIDKLQAEIEKQQKLLSLNLSKSPQTQTEAYLQHEIGRLAAENLDLQEKYDRMAEECRKLKKQLKILARRLKDAGYEESHVTECKDRSRTVPYSTESASDSAIVSTTTDPSGRTESNLPAIRKKEREYEGMFEFPASDTKVIIQRLVNDLKPNVAVTLLPGLPAYILFMCIRHTDCVNDDSKVRLLLTTYLHAVKKVMKKRGDFDSSVLWLTNTLRLLHNMKQYSGDTHFQVENTPRQNNQCLKNFDLGEFRLVFNDMALWICGSYIIPHLKERLHPLTVPAILEHDAITGLSQNKSAARPRASSVGDEPDSVTGKFNKLFEELTCIHKTFQYHGLDPQVIVAIFKQLFYFMCATALNNLLLRQELCHCVKGVQIKHNLSHLEVWSKERQLEEAVEDFQPIIQAALLLQARKRMEDINSICEMCNRLTAKQIIRILRLITPVDDYEERVPDSFIKEMEAHLSKRNENDEHYLLNAKHVYPLRFSFNPSDIRLEDIEVPEVLNLPMLKKL